MKYELYLQHPIDPIRVAVTAQCLPSVGELIELDSGKSVVVKRVEHIVKLRLPLCKTGSCRTIVTAW
jgi:hypothetical protein